MNMADPGELDRLKSLNLDLTPMRISEIVLKTSRFDELKAWYQGMLGVAPFFEHQPKGGSKKAEAGKQERATDIRLCFIRLHLEHPYAQTLAIFEVPGTKDAAGEEPGLHHMQLRNATMDDLFARYERLKSLGILPHRTANHGPGTSFYYRDPDLNIVEISASNFTTQADYLAYFTSDSYKRNPSGMEIDADAYVARYRSGVPLAELVKIPA
jgi:catechol-2,3-dioxygenase